MKKDLFTDVFLQRGRHKQEAQTVKKRLPNITAQITVRQDLLQAQAVVRETTIQMTELFLATKNNK